MSEDKFYIEEEDGWIYLKLENYPYTLFTQYKKSAIMHQLRKLVDNLNKLDFINNKDNLELELEKTKLEREVSFLRGGLKLNNDVYDEFVNEAIQPYIKENDKLKSEAHKYQQIEAIVRGGEWSVIIKNHGGIIIKPNFRIVEQKVPNYDEEIKQDRENGMKYYDVIDKYKAKGVPTSHIKNAMKESGWKKRPLLKDTLNNYGGMDFIKELKLQGYSLKQINQVLGYAKTGGVSRYCKINGCTFKSLPGTPNHKLVLTIEKLDEVKELIEQRKEI